MKRLTPQGQLLFIYENRIGSGKGLRDHREKYVFLTLLSRTD